MALSCFSNWSEELDFDLQHNFFLDENPFLDPIFEPSTNFNIPKPFASQQSEYQSYPHAQRIKFDTDNYYNFINSEYNSVPFDINSILYPTSFSNFSPPLELCQTTEESNVVTASAQSIAARKRRQKITDKTQELGKLIPGAGRMNTAEMFQAGYKYIQFLQAQLGILQLINTVQDGEDEFHSEELQKLASSLHVQQKLYSSEKCLVPLQLLNSLHVNCQSEINSKSQTLPSLRSSNT